MLIFKYYLLLCLIWDSKLFAFLDCVIFEQFANLVPYPPLFLYSCYLFSQSKRAVTWRCTHTELNIS